ncbi:MAG: peroxiredoxin [Pyrinomonadaceae bacterium]|nr:peroxiredoxin [Pyrinomonadaceae bacterium]MCX7639303.1 peroxiredoxin [Pyrinomonadaceae bacterium]MDW8303475.1 peroxiredoxin [Acidobacteriota bacterium]
MQVGEDAPDFVLKDENGDSWRLSENLGKTIVLIFYPGDDTPVCTKQLCSIRDNWEKYVATGALVIGISTDSSESHKKFIEKYNLPIKLLSDETADVVKKYGMQSWIPGYSARGVVIISKDGKIVYHKVQPLSIFRPKDDEIIEAIRAAEK